MRISKNITRLQAVLSGISIAVVILGSASLATAQSNSAIAQQFRTTEDNITPAALVGTHRDGSNAVELSNSSNAERLVGVVSEESLIDLSNDENGVQVVRSGLTKALVSDLNGPIVAGDKITASPIEGVGMKATEDATVVGTAQAALTSTKTKNIKDRSGKDVVVRIGLVPVQVGVAFYSADTGKSSIVPSFLQEVANNVAGRNVSPIRVLIAALILLLLFVSITVLLYTAVRSSIISIGRNPLSERAVRKSLLQIGLTIITMLVFAIVLIYLILRV
jgi:hypothetical protein